MKVLVLGGEGMLGSDLIPVWASKSDIVAPPRTACDITLADQVRSVIQSSKPDLVLLLAASTDVDRCQTDRNYAFGGNMLGPMVVSQECERAGASLLYTSTIAVFDGEKPAPYDEMDVPRPANTYGESKYQGELAVLRHCRKSWIVRTGWLFGGGARDMKFVAKILKRAGTEQIRVVEDCVGSPTYTSDLAEGLLGIVGSLPFGTYHLVNQGPPVSRYELARQVLSIAGFPSTLVTPVLSAQMGLPAPRPRMEAADCYLLGLMGAAEMMPDWRSSLEGYIRSRLAEAILDKGE